MPKIHGRHTRVYVNGNDISNFVTGADGVQTIDVAETSAFGDDDKEYLIGLASGTMRLTGWFDTEADETGVDSLLTALAQSAADPIVTVVHQAAIDALGEGGRASKLTNISRSSPIGGAVAFNCDFQAEGGFRQKRTVLPKSTLANGENGATTAEYNGGVATTLGAELFAHFFEVTTGTAVLTVQHSDDGGDVDAWTTLGTFTGVAGAGAPQAQRVTVTGSVKATLRVICAGGTVVAWVGIYQPTA